jgi:hypothetical protein
MFGNWSAQRIYFKGLLATGGMPVFFGVKNLRGIRK